MKQNKILFFHNNCHFFNTLANELQKENYHIWHENSIGNSLAILNSEDIHIIVSEIRKTDTNEDNIFSHARKIKSDSLHIALVENPDFSVITDIINNGGIWHLATPPWTLQKIKDLIFQAVCSLEVKPKKDELSNDLEEAYKKLIDENENLKLVINRQTNELTDSHQQVDNLNYEMIRRLLIASEYRDDDTGRHVFRVGKTARIISDCMGLSREFCHQIEIAAPMHDIGKIGITDTILLKPGALNENDFETIKKHVVIGAGILEGSEYPVLQMAKEIVQYHHEKWNGEGYLCGLQGEAIPISARITAVADVFDALSSKRPYKESFALDKSIEVIQKETNRHFDPAVVEGFLKAEREISRLYKELEADV